MFIMRSTKQKCWISFIQMTKKRRKKQTTIRDKLSISNREEDKADRLRKQFSIKRPYNNLLIKCNIQLKNGQMLQR